MLNLTNYFSKVRILDGGMGQVLLAKGLVVKGSLWSASALLDEKYHKLIIDTHLDFIKAGADVIITNNFSARRRRMVEDNVDSFFVYANEKAGELALKAKEISKKNILIGGSLPAQNKTYVLDERDEYLIEKDFFDQATIIRPFIDFFYLDVLSSVKECKIALRVLDKMDLPVLLGLHVKSNGKLPSNESISQAIQNCKNKNLIGVILACVSPEIIDKTINEIKECKIPFGYKANLWKIAEPLPHTAWKSEPGTNPIKVLGTRQDYSDLQFLNFTKKMIDKGATILGGCCEIKASHIQKISNLK